MIFGGADGVVRAGNERPAVLAAIHRESDLPAGGSAGVGSARSSRRRGRARRARSTHGEIPIGSTKKTPPFGGVSFLGGADGDRTHDLSIANAALSQLSYGPLTGMRMVPQVTTGRKINTRQSRFRRQSTLNATSRVA